jgi:hypothetical protein
MNLPTWNAEASLYQTSGPAYRARMSPQTNGAVSPAQIYTFRLPYCMNVCHTKCLIEGPICPGGLEWQPYNNEHPEWGGHMTCAGGFQRGCLKFAEVCECVPLRDVFSKYPAALASSVSNFIQNGQ